MTMNSQHIHVNKEDFKMKYLLIIATSLVLSLTGCFDTSVTGATSEPTRNVETFESVEEADAALAKKQTYCWGSRIYGSWKKNKSQAKDSWKSAVVSTVSQYPGTYGTGLQMTNYLRAKDRGFQKVKVGFLNYDYRYFGDPCGKW